MNEPLERMWVTRKFKKFTYGMKAECPEKPLHKVLDDVADEVIETRKKKRGEGYYPKF